MARAKKVSFDIDGATATRAGTPGCLGCSSQKLLLWAMACCTRPTGMSPHVQELTHKKLKEVATYYPGTYFAVVLGAKGELVSFHNDGVARPETVMQPLADMKRAALEFGTMGFGV